MSRKPKMTVTKKPEYHRHILVEIVALLAYYKEQEEAGDDAPTVADVTKMCFPFLAELVENMDEIESAVGHITEGSGDFCLILFAENLISWTAEELRTWQYALTEKYLV